MFSSVRRPVGAVALSAALVLAAAACSDDDPATSNTVTIKPSSYVVRDAVTTTVVTVPVDTTPTADGRSPVEQAYTVQADDNPSQIAALYDIDLDELRNYNGWASDYSDFPAVDGTVRIPPNALFIDPNAPPATNEEGEEDAEAETTEADADDGDCAAGTYAVEDGDNPSRIAEKFDVTLEALTAANGWDASYSNFPGTGENITIPAPANCTPTT